MHLLSSFKPGSVVGTKLVCRPAQETIPGHVRRSYVRNSATIRGQRFWEDTTGTYADLLKSFPRASRQAQQHLKLRCTASSWSFLAGRYTPSALNENLFVVIKSALSIATLTVHGVHRLEVCLCERNSCGIRNECPSPGTQ